MSARNASVVVLATLASAAFAGCGSEVASQAREICFAAAHSQGGGIGEVTDRYTRGWDSVDGPVVVEGDWYVTAGEPDVDASGRDVEWRAGYTYPWTCTVSSGKLSDFKFAWGPQEAVAPQPSAPPPRPDPEPATGPGPCLIKGNISIDTREKIYHLPSQAYYEETVINEAYGERWFCTEQEALDAGWRKAHV